MSVYIVIERPRKRAIRVVGFGSFDFGSRGQNVMEIEDEAQGKRLLRVYRRMFREIRLDNIVSAKSRASVEESSAEVVSEASESADAPDLDLISLDGMTFAQLKAIAKERGVKSWGVKRPELIALLKG